jgi:APA family basic amino acid/polyamine antiporter
MSTTTTTPDTTKARGSLGLPQATALIVGSIIGVGIFNLPGSLAAYGPISIIAMALTTVGALALAYMFAAMSRRLPADGGPYAYARVAFGNPTGFANAWSYWITAWAGNAAIVVGWVFYVQYVIEGWITANDGDTAWIATTIGGENGLLIWPVVFAMVGLWIPAVINLIGVKSMGTVQLWTSVIKFIPLVLMSTIGLLTISTANFDPMNVSGDSDVQAILGAMALCLFSYPGSRRPPWRRPRCATPTSTCRSRRSSARSRPPLSTCSRSSRSSARRRPPCSARARHRTPLRPT